jgi:preprotein translocase subunit YajC
LPYNTLILIALMVVAFYFLIIRPNKKRQQAQLRVMNSLQPGTRVLMGSGIFGTIVTIGDKQAVLELSPGVQLTVLKQAISRAVTPADEDPAAIEETDDEDVPLEETDLEPTAEPFTTYGGTSAGTNGSTHEAAEHDPHSGANTTQNKD